MSTPEKPAEQSPASARLRPLVPGVRVWGVVIVSLALLTFVRMVDVTNDIAVTNVITLILAFIAAMTLLVWFVALSGYPRPLRLGTVAVLGLAVVTFFAAFRIEQVTGSLIPTFRWRLAPPKDALLEQPKASEGEAAIDLTRTSPGDFPQFLGPHRNGVVEGVRLKRNWNDEPPARLWRQPIGGGWSSFAAVDGVAITLEQRGDRELVTCYEVETGRLLWSHAEEGRHETVLGGVGPRSTPTIHEGRIYVTTAQGKVLCLDASGQVVWRVDLYQLLGTDRETDMTEVAWGRAGSPLLVDGMVVVPAGGPRGKAVSLIALDQQDGHEIWRGGTTQISYASPVVATLSGVRQIVSVNENNVTGHDLRTGRVLWESPWEGNSSANATCSQPQIIGDNRVLLSKGYSMGSKLLELSADGDALSPSVVWERPQQLRTKFTNVVVVDGYGYALSEGVLECVDLTTGEIAWKGKRRRAGDYGHGQILAVGDVLLVQAENGEVAMVDLSPQEFRELGRFKAIAGKTWNNLCIYQNYLLVRNGEEAACYKLALAETPDDAAESGVAKDAGD